MIAAARIDSLMNQGWPAAHSTELDGWLVRRNAGVTLRANSVLPKSAPFDLGKALDYVENLYAAHDIAPSFQVGPAAQPGDLDARLAARGYEVRNPTLVMGAELTDVLANLGEPASPVNISSAPDDAWMDFWWAVDGRGGSGAQAAARQILNRARALYAVIPSGEPVKAIGRLALVNDWAGLYCLAVDPQHRRQGLAQAVIHGLLHEASTLGVNHVWLQVVESNTPARALYERLGFRTVSRYHYRVKA
ncbi:GNAT family N-acetyltransferase [Kribbella jejuensis]|uniref:Acetyltransferase (GNAT) family protein n=1 Tax=Kribbella jejuensis TaxID=236068 RepID=A0A542EWJ7_9ACTN|nr:GNAT family N-acetyltransferase [Kribbella jejuensis]TQJ19697.1 acetyltransferase (GNAT) family protein [Kribbella jejuensis]